MKKPTIYEIADRVAKTEPYFFSKDTLKFFGQKKADFRVSKKRKDGKHLISAPIKNPEGEIIGHTKRYYDPITNRLERITNK